MLLEVGGAQFSSKILGSICVSVYLLGAICFSVIMPALERDLARFFLRIVLGILS